jgi:hypothetical protein
MATLVSNITNIGSILVLHDAAAAGKNPTDNDVGTISRLTHNLGKHPIGHWSGAELHCNMDNNTPVGIEGLEKYIPKYGTIQIRVNATGTNVYGSSPITGFCELQGSIDKKNWIELQKGLSNDNPKLSDSITYAHWIIDEIVDVGPVVKSAGRWPYLRILLTHSSNDNSDKQVKIVIHAGNN